MSINQILQNEQITLMRFVVATDLGEILAHQRKLAMFRHLLEAHPYPHHPYSQRAMVKGHPGSRRAGMVGALSVWENEGGAS